MGLLGTESPGQARLLVVPSQQTRDLEYIISRRQPARPGLPQEIVFRLFFSIHPCGVFLLDSSSLTIYFFLSLNISISSLEVSYHPLSYHILTTLTMSDRDHVLELPKFVFIIRCVQAGLALVVLGLSAYAVSEASIDGVDLALFAVSLPPKALVRRIIKTANRLPVLVRLDCHNLHDRCRTEIPYHLQLLGFHGSGYLPANYLAVGYGRHGR